MRSAADYDDVRRIMEEENRVVPVIAKIEKPQAVENLAEIIAAFDGIMVARGDLGVELPLEQVPLVQKRAVELARRNAKPVIVATQVLESMTTNPRPTRAETSDCANAVLDGADAVMLSGETSVGDYPIETVRTMARIIEATEELGRERIAPLGSTPHTRGGAITRAAAEIGETLDVKYLVTFTQSGDSARRMSRLRSAIPLLAFTPVDDVRNVLSLSWGVQTYRVPVGREHRRDGRARWTPRCAPTVWPRSATTSSSSPVRRWAWSARPTRSSCTRSVTRRTRAGASPDAFFSSHDPFGPAPCTRGRTSSWGASQTWTGNVTRTATVVSRTTPPIAIIAVRLRGEPSLEPMPEKKSTDAHRTVAST